jgi:predicted transcriptional regulator
MKSNRGNKRFVGLTLSDEEYEKLSEFAKNEHRSISSAIRASIFPYIAKIHTENAQNIAV